MKVQFNNRIFENIAEIQKHDEGVQLVNYNHEIVDIAKMGDTLEVILVDDEN